MGGCGNNWGILCSAPSNLSVSGLISHLPESAPRDAYFVAFVVKVVMQPGLHLALFILNINLAGICDDQQVF